VLKVIFWHGHQQYVYFFAVLYLPQDGSDESFRSDGVGDPLQALLEGALGQQAACQLWFHFWYKKKGCWCEIWQKMKLGGHLDAFFLPPITENIRSDGFLGDGRQKTSFVPTWLVF
jgi:hypothetical protein